MDSMNGCLFQDVASADLSYHVIESEAVGGAEIVSVLQSGRVKLNKNCRRSSLYQKYFKSTFYFLFFQNKITYLGLLLLKTEISCSEKKLAIN